jgi:type II secretion system protein N
MNPRVQAIIDRVRAIDLTPLQRKILMWAGYPVFALFVAALAFYWSVPRDRVKDRLETALSADVTSGQPLAIGMDVNIGDLSLTLFTGAGFKASDIVLRTRPLTPGEKPARYIVDDLRVRLGLLSTIFGKPAYSFKAHALSGTVSGHAAGNMAETRVAVEIDKLVLNGVPGIQQALAGLPLDGTVSGKLDVQVPKNLLANANGGIDVSVDELAIGDGKAKLTVPNDPFLSAGVTFPRIKLGKLQGQIVIEKGKARFEGVRVHSADGDAVLEGYVELHDPIATSLMHAYLKFRPSEALLKREPTVELLNNAMTATARRNDGFIGIQMTGPLAGVFFLPSKEPPFGVTTKSEPGAVGATGGNAPVAPAFVPPPNTTAPPVAPPVAEPTPPTPPPAAPAQEPAAAQPTPAPSSPASPPSGGAVQAPGYPPEGGGRVAPPPPLGGMGPPPAIRTLRPEAIDAPPKPE